MDINKNKLMCDCIKSAKYRTYYNNYKLTILQRACTINIYFTPHLPKAHTYTSQATLYFGGACFVLFGHPRQPVRHIFLQVYFKRQLIKLTSNMLFKHAVLNFKTGNNEEVLTVKQTIHRMYFGDQGGFTHTSSPAGTQ